MTSKTYVILCIVWGCLVVFCNGETILKVLNGDNELEVIYYAPRALTFIMWWRRGTPHGHAKLFGDLGVKLKVPSKPCIGIKNCLEGNGVRLHITTEVEEAFTIIWSKHDDGTEKVKQFEDCFTLKFRSWYGGPQRKEQRWPLQNLILDNFANVVQADQSGAVVEPYWLNAQGAYMFVDRKVPLFINQNTIQTRDEVCFSAQLQPPYPPRDKLVLQYTIAGLPNVREAHLHAVKHFLGKPKGHPNVKLIENPIWSTWARYKRDINDTVVEAFAEEIVNNGYTGQFEIDDNWEKCHGSLTFDGKKFSNINTTINNIKALGFTVSLWVHPFVNLDCTEYVNLGRKYGYFVKNADGSDLTTWWNSKKNEALHLDFTNSEVRSWFAQRLKILQTKYGIDSFKFDAGETSWLPQVPVLRGDVDDRPNNMAEAYVRMAATFGDLVEVRSAWKTQDLPIFVRMLDKDSKWGIYNGLLTLITTLLQMNLNGYTMVLPDMVGGNGYNNDKVDAELFIRWLQANVFMPSIQFSYVPWDFKSKDFDVKKISKSMVDLHQRFSPDILKQMNRSIVDGHPVNAPVWWVDQKSPKALQQHTQFMLGDDIMVAPVVVIGDRSRNVYLPSGQWYDANTKIEYKAGDVIIQNYPAAIDVLPYFLRVGSDVYNREVVVGGGSLSSYNLANHKLFGFGLFIAICKMF